MTLEDRLRRGFDAQRADTAARLGAPGAIPAFEPRQRSLAGPMASVAIGLVGCVALAGFLLRDPGTEVIREDLAPIDEFVIETTTSSAPTASTIAGAIPAPEPTAATTTAASLPAPVAAATIVPTPVAASSSVPKTTTPPAPATASPTTIARAATSVTPSIPAAPATPTASTTPQTSAVATTLPSPVVSTEPDPDKPDDVAVANSECASGFRAPLEQATLRYIGPNEGWGRIDDLVDEQNGPFYFEAWEPGYPNDVTVEVRLSAPVRATAIMVAQDPFTPVSGDIDIDSAVASGAIELSGTDGWRSLIVPSNPMLSVFTIRRDAPSENIMEVLVCVVDPAT